MASNDHIAKLGSFLDNFVSHPQGAAIVYTFTGAGLMWAANQYYFSPVKKLNSLLEDTRFALNQCARGFGLDFNLENRTDIVQKVERKIYEINQLKKDSETTQEIFENIKDQVEKMETIGSQLGIYVPNFVARNDFPSHTTALINGVGHCYHSLSEEKSKETNLTQTNQNLQQILLHATTSLNIKDTHAETLNRQIEELKQAKIKCQNEKESLKQAEEDKENNLAKQIKELIQAENKCQNEIENLKQAEKDKENNLAKQIKELKLTQLKCQEEKENCNKELYKKPPKAIWSWW